MTPPANPPPASPPPGVTPPANAPPTAPPLKLRPLKVLALTRTSSIGPSTRYRILQYRPLLAAAGIRLETRPLFGPTWFRILDLRLPLVRPVLKALYSAVRLVARTAQVLAARRSDAELILIEQQLFPYLPARIEEWLWPRRQPTILEFDDAIYLTFAHEPKLRRLCARASLVIVGNRFLEAFAAATARRVVVIPTTLDLARYPEAPHPLRSPGDIFRVGWIGLPYNFAYLAELAPSLAALARDGPVELAVISRGLPEPGPAWGNVRLVEVPWSEQFETAELARCHAAIMPLPDSPWARGKCGLKLLQGMAAGVPVVASPVGVNADIVKHGENGLLAADPAGWQASLTWIRDHPEAADAMARAGRQTVRDSFSMQAGARALADAYRLASGAQVGETYKDPGHSAP